MLKCSNCGNVFDEEDAKAFKESYGYFDGYGEYYQIQQACPRCSDLEVDEAYRCDICGEWFTENELSNATGVTICPDCAKKIVQKLDKMIDHNFNGDEIEFIWNNIDRLDDFLEDEQ